MGRLVWFAAPIIGGFGLPAIAVVAAGAVLVGGAYWFGRRSAQPKTSAT